MELKDTEKVSRQGSENFYCKGSQEMGWQLQGFMGFLSLDIITHSVKNYF